MIGCFSDFYFGIPGVSSSRGSSPDSLVLGLLGTQKAWIRCLLRFPLVAGDPRCLYLVSGGYRSFMSVSRKICWTGGMPLRLLPCCTWFCFFGRSSRKTEIIALEVCNLYAKCQSVFYDFLISRDECHLSDSAIGPHRTGST